MAFRGCEICKQPIEAERAESDPLTRLCSEHAREIAQFGGEFSMVASQDLTSKQGSLKKNYGDVTTARRRNEDAVRKLRAAYDERLGT